MKMLKELPPGMKVNAKTPAASHLNAPMHNAMDILGYNMLSEVVSLSDKEMLEAKVDVPHNNIKLLLNAM